MTPRSTIVSALAFALALAAAPTTEAASTGVQWTPDGTTILVNKDVDDARWAITLTLADASTAGTVYVDDGGDPAFLWCERVDRIFEPAIGELTLQYRCFGADRALGGFGFEDWSAIGDQILLPASFFIPAAETCDLTDAVNGATASLATSYWTCNGNAGAFDFQVFGDGTGVSSAIGPFAFDVVAQACTFGQLADDSFLDLEYSPSRDRLTVYEVTPEADQFYVSECGRQDF